MPSVTLSISCHSVNLKHAIVNSPNLAYIYMGVGTSGEAPPPPPPPLHPLHPRFFRILELESVPATTYSFAKISSYATDLHK